jgi:hypothetical protein
MMTKSLLAIALLTGAATASLAGFAHPPQEVAISGAVGNTGYASGNLGDVRRSADAVQTIGCYIRWGATASGSYLSCSARSAAGQYVSCFSYEPSPHMMAAIASIDENASLGFGWSANGDCTSVMVTKTSQRLSNTVVAQ